MELLARSVLLLTCVIAAAQSQSSTPDTGSTPTTPPVTTPSAAPPATDTPGATATPPGKTTATPPPEAKQEPAKPPIPEDSKPEPEEPLPPSTAAECRNALFLAIFASETGIQQLGLQIGRLNDLFQTYFKCHERATESNPLDEEYLRISESAKILTAPSLQALINGRVKSCVEPAHKHEKYKQCAEEYEEKYAEAVNRNSEDLTQAWCSLIKDVDDFFKCVAEAYFDTCTLQQFRKLEGFSVGLTQLIRGVCSSCPGSTFGCKPPTQANCRDSLLSKFFLTKEPPILSTIPEQFDGKKPAFCQDVCDFNKCLEATGESPDQASLIAREATDVLCSQPFISRVRVRGVKECFEKLNQDSNIKSCQNAYVEDVDSTKVTSPSQRDYCELIPPLVSKYVNCIGPTVGEVCQKVQKFLLPIRQQMIVLAGSVCPA